MRVWKIHNPSLITWTSYLNLGEPFYWELKWQDYIATEALSKHKDKLQCLGGNVSFVFLFTGLGPEGIGRKFPVKTVLKRDRLGLGSKGSEQARVTHFGPNDHNAVKRRKVSSKEKQKGKGQRRLGRRERQTLEKKEKNWERNMRIYMNSEWINKLLASLASCKMCNIQKISRF